MDNQSLYIHVHLHDGTTVQLSGKDTFTCSKLLYQSELSSNEILEDSVTKEMAHDGTSYSLKSGLHADDFRLVELVPNENPQLAIIRELSTVKCIQAGEEASIIQYSEMLKGKDKTSCLLFGRYEAGNEGNKHYKVELYLMND